nr:uncharacterized protein LOC131780094 [Pocillopora verrucosa]
MIRYALSMFILVCSHATLSSAENSLEEMLLQYEEYMNVNPDEEIQDSVIPLTSLIDKRTLQAKAGKKETVLAELLEPAYREQIQAIPLVPLSGEETLKASDEEKERLQARFLTPGHKKSASIRVNEDEQIQDLEEVRRKKSIVSKWLNPGHKKIQEVNGILVRSDWILDPKKVSITINEDE